MFSKLETVCRALDKRASEDALIDWLVEVLSESAKKTVLIDCISQKMIADIIRLRTGIKITGANFFYYRSKGLDLLERVQGKSGLFKTLDTNHAVELSGDNREPIVKIPENSVSAALKELSKLMSHHSSLVVYEFWWQNAIFITGCRKWWPSKSLVRTLFRHGHELNIPLSHNRPSLAAELTRHIGLLYRNELLRSQEELDYHVRKYCQDKLSQIKNKGGRCLFPQQAGVHRVNSMSKTDKAKPYFYVKRTESGGKIGSADKSPSRVATGDNALVFVLEAAPSMGAARLFENVVREELRKFHIKPMSNTRDFYRLSFEKLARIVWELSMRDERINPLISKVLFVS